MLASGGWTPQARLKTAFVSSFTVEPLADFTTVEAANASLGLQTYCAPYGQAVREMLDSASGLYAFNPDITFLIVEAESLANDPLKAANDLISFVRTFTESTAGTLVVCTFMVEPQWPLHLLPSDLETTLSAANAKLKEAFADDTQVQVCDLDALAAYYGRVNALSPEMTAMARIPFSEGFLSLLAQKIVSHLKVKAGLIRKCLVLDCDNTLWGGIIGEDGIDGIALGPDWPGREFVDFQNAVLELYRQGVILAINSKNNEPEVLRVLRDHPHCLLREEHFAAVCVNWLPKPENMKAIARQLNIGLDTLVFADDSPVERELMRQTLPQVAVIDLPQNPALFARALRQTGLFVTASLTEEDKQRGRMYAARRQRTELEKTAPSLTDFLASLEMVCTIRPAQPQDVKRIAQMTQRTNQFNLTTRRYSEDDIRRLLDNPDMSIFVLGLRDKFGDNGTVGLAIVEQQAEQWRMDTFLMSCRVIGRQAEEALLDYICRRAIEVGAVQINAEFIPTAKNAPAADFWDRMQLSRVGQSGDAILYRLDLSTYQPKTFAYLKLA